MTPENSARARKAKNLRQEECFSFQGAKKLSLEEKLFLMETKKDRVSHIKIDQKKCRSCRHKACLIVCPAKTYENRHGKIEVSFENCLECGSCRVACKEKAISWENPRGGFGVIFKNG